MQKTLEGVKILDMTMAVSGPACTRLLADFGAEDILVEPIGGSSIRTFGPNSMGFKTYGKKSLCMNLKTDEGKEAFHKGVDLACASGTIVLAGADGIVAAARHSQSYGNYLRLSHTEGEETLYAHMQYLYVRTGEVVKAGEPIGTVGQTGRATGAHLHLEWLCNGIRYDPAGILDFL